MKVLLFVGIIAVTLAIGESFKCYNCTDCEDPFNKDAGKTMTCRNKPVCLKLVVEFDNDKKRTDRMCLESWGERASIRENELFPKVQSIYACKEDLCNGAPSIQSVSLLLSILTIVTVKLIQ